MTKQEKENKAKVKELVVELTDLFLKESGSELSERGLFHRVMPLCNQLGGSVDKNTVQLSHFKSVLEELNEVIK